MEYVKLGNSPLTVSRLCVGCMSFGDPASRMHAWTLDPAESEEIVKHALSLGINFFDTANTYSAGTSEEYLGRAIRSNVPRDQVILASKVYFNEGHLSREAILREIDGTLQRLGTDYLTCTSSTALTQTRPSRRRWRRWTALYGREKYVRWALPRCTAINSSTCSLQRGTTAGRHSFPCKTTTTCSTARMSGS